MRQGANSLTERLCARETGNLREHLPARFALPVALRGGRGIDDEQAQGQAAVMRLMLASARLVPAMAPRLALAHCSRMMAGPTLMATSLLRLVSIPAMSLLRRTQTEA